MSVQFSGTTVEKVGAAVALRFIIAVAGGYAYKESKTPKLGGNTTALDNYNQKYPKDKIITSSFTKFYKSLDIKLSGAEYEGKNVHMAPTERTDNTTKLVIGNKSKLDQLGEWLVNDHKKDIEITQDQGGQKTVFKTTGVSDGDVKFYIGLEVCSYSPQLGANGNIKNGKNHKSMTSPATGFGTYSVKSYSRKAKVQICMDFWKCKSSDAGLKKMGFTGSDGVYISDDYFKLTTALEKKIGTDVFMYTHTEDDGSGTLKPKAVGFCKAMISEFCAVLKDAADIGDDEDPSEFKQLVEGTNVGQIGGADLKCPTKEDKAETSKCVISAKYKQPIYDKLVEHMTASGFTTILPGSFKPCSVVRNTNAGGNNYQYEFFGYEITGEYAKISTIASESVKIWEIGGDAPGGKIRLLPIVPKSLKKDPKTGAYSYDTVKNLAFATTVKDLERLNKDFAEEEYKFTAEIYANLIRETTYQMAEVWHQTAQLTLNDPREEKDHINAKIIKDKIYDNGGQEHDAFLQGTKLDMKGFLFNSFSTFIGNAGIKFGTNKVKFQSDIVARELTEDAEGNTESGEPFTWTATSSITIEDLMSFIKSDDGEDKVLLDPETGKPIIDPETGKEKRGRVMSKSAFKDKLQINLPTVKDGAYDIDDISFSYDFTWWNNWKFTLDVDKDVKSWEDVGLKGVWDIEDGKELTISKTAGGNKYGLDMSWRIDATNPETYNQKGLQNIISILDKAVVKSGICFDADTGEVEFTAGMSKKLAEGINASISLTDANITADFDKKYKYGRYGQLDIGFTGGFGKSFDLFNKGAKEKETDGGDNLGGENVYDTGYYDANLNLDFNVNLFRVANNLGRIVFDVSAATSLTQASGVVRGISLTSVIQWKLTYQNNICSTLLGLPANVHPHIGGTIGFTMQDVESSYWGTKYSGYKMTIGTGLFGISIVEHSRKDVIEDIIERKRYGKLQFFGAGLLEVFDFFGWVTDEETDEDYIARAWPCLVYNVINWQREDYDKQLQDDVKTLKQRVDLSGCEILKSTPGVGKSFQDFYQEQYGACYPCLGEVADAFYNGGSHYQLQRYGLEPGSYKQSVLMGPNSTGAAAGEPSDRWYHWTKIDILSGAIGGKAYFDTRPGLVDTGERRPEVKIPLSAKTGDWINQNGVILSGKLVRQVRGFNSFWGCPIIAGETKCQNPLDGFPNMPADGSMWGSSYAGGNTGFLNSACFAFMYMMREIIEFRAPLGYCDKKNTSDCEPCESLIEKWKLNEIRTGQTNAIKLGIQGSLIQKKELLADELDGLTKERSISNTLFEAFSTKLFKNDDVRGKGAANVRGFTFDTMKYLEGGDDHYPRNSLYQETIDRETGKVKMVGWMPKGPNGEPWLDSIHEVTNFDGSTRRMKMLSAHAVEMAIKQRKNPTREDEEENSEESALINLHTDPVWGLVKCYFTYMAPLGPAERTKVVEDGVYPEGHPEAGSKKYKVEEDPLFLLPYNPNTPEAIAKRKEIRARNASLSSGLEAFEQQDDGDYILYNNDNIPNGPDGKPLFADPGQWPTIRDKFGNLSVEVYKDYRAGWVYRRRNPDGTVGEIEWVVPCVQAYKHTHKIGKVGKLGKVFDAVIKLASSGRNHAVTDVCGFHKNDRAGWRRVVGWFGGIWNFIKNLFVGSSQQFYRNLPWVYLDNKNYVANINEGEVPRIIPLNLNRGKFRYFPKGAEEDESELPSPQTMMLEGVQHGLYRDSDRISYQECPWKGNPASSYLDFYEFMEYVQRDALQYFFPEILGMVTSEDINRFCITKENSIKIFGYFPNSIILIGCKKCDTCTTRAPVDGASVPWPEAVGLRSMLGPHDNPSTDLTVTLDKSLGYIAKRTWPAWQNLQFSETSTFVFEESSTEEQKLEERQTKTFDSLRDKYDFIMKRLNYLNAFSDSSAKVFGDSSVTMPFPEKKEFWYPNYTAENRVKFVYEKGESISSIGEQASLVGILTDYSSTKLSEYNPNLKSIQFDFELIASDPKYVEQRGATYKHKFTDYRIAPDSSSIGSVAGQGCVGKGSSNVVNNNTGGRYCTTSAIAKDVNDLVALTKPIATDFIETAGGLMHDEGALGLGYLDPNGHGDGLSAGSKIVRQPTENDWSNFVAVQQQIGQTAVLNYPMDEALRFMGAPYYCFPDFTAEYMTSSLSLFEKFIPLYGHVSWLFDKDNLDNLTKQEKQNKAWFYNYVRNDIDASALLFRIKMTPWRNMALDVLISYWQGKIHETDLVWHLNKRLFPLIYTMNKTSPIFIPKAQETAFLGSKYLGLRFFLSEIPNVVKGGYRTSAHDTHCPRQGISWSYFQGSRWSGNRWKNQGLRKENFARQEGRVVIEDDLIYMHRNNVLALLFGVGNVEQFIKEGRRANRIEDHIYNWCSASYALFRMQVNADESIYAGYNANNPNSTVNVKPEEHQHPIEVGLINAMTRSFHDGSTDPLGGALSSCFQRPFGRDRYNVFHPRNPGSVFTSSGFATYKSKYGNDLHFHNIFYSGEKIRRTTPANWRIQDNDKKIETIYGFPNNRSEDWVEYQFRGNGAMTTYIGDPQRIAVPTDASHSGITTLPPKTAEEIGKISRKTGQKK